MALNRFHLLTLPLAAASLTFAACGGDDSTASGGDDRAEFREAALEFAQCMREHGVDMPDPRPDGGVVMRAGPDTDRAAVERAQNACRKHLEKVEPPEIDEDQQREFREQALKHAQCMREHGIDMPDPTFAGEGRVQQRVPEGLDPESPRFREAQEACSEYRPEMRTENRQ